MINANKQINKNNKESGIALIAVLCTILVVSLLVASAVAISQYMAFESSTFSGISRSFYIAEGASARIRWLLMADRRRFPIRKLEDNDSEIVESERYLADAKIHNLDYYGRNISFQIEDAAAGIDISSASPETNLRTLFTDIDSSKNEDLEFAKFCSKLHDYADSDDFLSVNGMEKKNYREYELYNLPRNGKLQFAQEIMYIPEFEEYFSTDEYGRIPMFRIIPPEKLTNKSGRPSLFSSPLDLIKNKCKLSDSETEQVAEALRKWTTENIPLTDSLEPGLKGRLTTYFSVVESGLYTFVVNTADKEVPGTTLIFSFYYRPNSKSTLEYYQFTFY